jgi:ESS family glutamate:Na+ symporter
MTSPDYKFKDFKAIVMNGYMKNTSLITELSELDLRESLKSVSVPYHIIQGETDIVTCTSSIVSFVEESDNPNLTCKVIPNSAHIPGVNGMQAVFEEMGWEAGSALGYTTATVGMIIGVIVGMTLINNAVRKGEIKYIRSYEDLSKAEQRGFYPINRRPAAGMQTVMCDSIDSLAWHLSVVGLAILVGYLLKEALLLINFILPDSISSLRIIESIPLFPLCMIGGLVIQQFLNATRLSPLIDRGQINRIGGASLDFLVVAAVSTIQLKFIVGNWLPLAILLLVGISWSLFSAKILSKIMFKEDRFERMICEFGQFTGVTATGLLLLRTADPESKTSASTAFGCKQLFHEPIMGGGVWTAMAVPLVIKLGPWWVVLISFAMMVIWWSIWYFFLRKGADKTK